MSAAEELVQENVGADFQHRIFDGDDLVAWNGEVSKPWLEKRPWNQPTRATHEPATQELLTQRSPATAAIETQAKRDARDASKVVGGGPDPVREWILLGTVALVFASVGAMLGIRR